MSKKLIVVIICLIITLLLKKESNASLKEAEAMLVAKMFESEKAVEVFAMDEWSVET